jgi:methylated-DNA-protein-cysteine methyltransferase-like protein
MASFRDLVFALVPRVPPGQVTSYGRLAAALGHPGKAREVGWALSSIPEDANLNAYRVVNRDGFLSGGWAFGAPEVQRALLEQEGVEFLPDGRVDLERFLWPEEAARAAAREILQQSDRPV